jgi:hypothetical protein
MNAAVKDSGFPVVGDPNRPIDVPLRVRDPTKWRRQQYLTVDEAAKALGVTEDQIAGFVRDGKLGARWIRCGTVTVPVVRRRGVDKLAQMYGAFTDDDLGEDWLIRRASARFSECPHCGNEVELDHRTWLFVSHQTDAGETCPGGVHGQSDFPIDGDPIKSPRVKFGEDADKWLDDHGWLLLEEALDVLQIPDDESALAMRENRLRTGWVRHDGETHPLVKRLDVKRYKPLKAKPPKVVKTPRKKPVKRPRQWYAAWRWEYMMRIRNGLEHCRVCGDEVALSVGPIDDGRLDFDNATILCVKHMNDWDDPDTGDLVDWRLEIPSLREEELDRPESERWGFIAAIERGKMLAAKYEESDAGGAS